MIWGFPKMVGFPNNNQLVFLLKLIILGCEMGVPPFNETPMYLSASTSTDIHQTVAPPQLFPRPPAAHSPETVSKVSTKKPRADSSPKGEKRGGEKDPRQHLPPQHKKRAFPVCPSVATFGDQFVVFRVERWSCPYCWQLHSFQLKRSEYFGTTYHINYCWWLNSLIYWTLGCFLAFWHCKFFWGCRKFTVPIHGCAGTNTQLNSMTGSMPCIREHAKLNSVQTLEVEVDYFLNGFSPKTIVCR